MPVSLNLNSFAVNHAVKTSKALAKQQQGFSLVEVMVSLLLVSMGMISLTNLQTRSVNTAVEAYIKTQSALHLQEMVELLHANKIAAANGVYNIALSKFSDVPTGGTSIAKTDRYHWFNNMNNTLPGAKASINCIADSNCLLEIEQSISGASITQSLAVIL